MIGREPRVQPPALDAYSDMPLFNTKAVVHHTGVPAPTLRAWERRYGILSPRRGENDYRLYSERDMMMVTWLRERVENGMTISQAIALLRSIEPARKRGRRVRPTPAPAGELVSQEATAAAPCRLALDDLGARLLAHFVHFDEPGATQALAQALAVYSIEEVCLELITPVMTRAGHDWARGELSVTVEHFASAFVRAQLDSLFRCAAVGERGPLVLAGCVPGELHEIGALTLALFLRRAGVRVAYLGQNLEIDGLVNTIATLRPACVVLSAAMPQHVASLTEVAERMKGLAVAQPGLFYGGQAFEQRPELAEGLPGQFLGIDMRAAVEDIKHRLSA